MHIKNDNEMNSNANATTTTATGNCASSTESGVIINNNIKRGCSNEHDSDNKNKHSINSNCNSTSSKIAKDNCNNDSYANTDKRWQGEENSNITKNIIISNNNDSNSINIENIINIDAANNARQQRSTLNDSRRGSKCSPTVSIRSNIISITSIDENGTDSTVADSDSDFEGEHGSYVVKKLGQQTTYEPNHPNLPHINKCMEVVSQTITPGALQRSDNPLSGSMLQSNAGTVLSTPFVRPPMPPNAPQIGTVALSNTTDVTFGDKHFYEGPVTIQQFLIDSRDKRTSGEQDGQDNATYTDDSKTSEVEAAPEHNYLPLQPEPPYKFIFSRRPVIITGAIIVLTIIIGILIVTVNVFTKQTIRKIPLEDSEYIFNGSLLIISKDEWFAEAERDGVNKLNLPLQNVIIAHTASTRCENKVECDSRVKVIQSLHIHSFGWSDIGYNFLVGGDGLVYEGRGWYKEGAHTKGYNKGSIGIAFIGTFNKEVPTENDFKAAKLLIEEGLGLGVLVQDYRLYGARQLSGTESPGKALYTLITKWPHWSSHI